MLAGGEAGNGDHHIHVDRPEPRLGFHRAMRVSMSQCRGGRHTKEDTGLELSGEQRQRTWPAMPEAAASSASVAGALMACKYSLLGTPRGRYDENSSKSSLSCETKVYRTSRRKPNFRR
jgi:hypothetical protein